MGNTIESQLNRAHANHQIISDKYEKLLKDNKERHQKYQKDQDQLQNKINDDKKEHELAQDKLNMKLKNDNARFNLIYQNMEEKLEMKKELIETVEKEKERIRKEFETKAQDDKKYREKIKKEFDEITEAKTAEFNLKLSKEQKEKESMLTTMNNLNKIIEEEKDPKNFAGLQRKNFDEFIIKLAKSRGIFNDKNYDNINIGVVGSVSVGKTSLLRVLTETIIGTVNKGESTRDISKLCSLKLDNSTNEFIRSSDDNDLYKKYRSIESTETTEGITEDNIEMKNKDYKIINIWDTPGLHDRKAYYTPEVLSHFKSLDLVLVMYINSPMTILNVLLTLKAMLIPFILVKSKIDINDSGFDAFEDEESSLDETIEKDVQELEQYLGYTEVIYKISSTNTYKNKIWKLKGMMNTVEDYDWKTIVDIIKNTK